MRIVSLHECRVFFRGVSKYVLYSEGASVGSVADEAMIKFGEDWPGTAVLQTPQGMVMHRDEKLDGLIDTFGLWENAGSV